MSTRTVSFAAAALVLAVGLGLKAERYAGRFADHKADDQARVAAVLAKDGWSPVANAGAPLPFDFATFAKPGCTGNVVIATLGSSRELVDEVKLALGPGTGFVETAGPLGLLAVWPAPAAGDARCSAPAADRWPQL